jgi:hypothetical protein
MKIQAVKARWVFGGTQVSSCKDAIVVIKVSPSSSNHLP